MSVIIVSRAGRHCFDIGPAALQRTLIGNRLGQQLRIVAAVKGAGQAGQVFACAAFGQRVEQGALFIMRQAASAQDACGIDVTGQFIEDGIRQIGQHAFTLAGRKLPEFIQRLVQIAIA